MGFGHFHYVPIVKWKQFEQLGVEDLDASVKAKITPLIEVVEIGANLTTGKRNRTPDRHVVSAVKALVKSWGTKDRFMLDCRLAATEVLANGSALPDATYHQAASNSLRFVPVIRLDASSPEKAAAKRHLNNGVCIRIATLNAFEPDRLPSLLEATLDAFSIAPKDVDIVIDLGSVCSWMPSLITDTSIHVLNALPNLTSYRTVALVASNFPSPLPGKTNSTSVIPRTEWTAWRGLFRKFQGTSPPISRMPSFGDYGVQHPAGVEGIDYRVIDPPAAVRYTVTDNWFIAKKLSVRKHGGAQFRQLAKDLVASVHYCGDLHCNGCAAIKRCSVGKLPAASLGYWRRLGTTHHFTMVQQDLSALAAP